MRTETERICSRVPNRRRRGGPQGTGTRTREVGWGLAKIEGKIADRIMTALDSRCHDVDVNVDQRGMHRFAARVCVCVCVRMCERGDDEGNETIKASRVEYSTS